MKKNVKSMLGMALVGVVMAATACGGSSAKTADTQAATTAAASEASAADTSAAETSAAGDSAAAGQSLDELCKSEEGPLIIGTYGGRYDDALQEAVIKQFQEKYGVEVILEPGYNAAKLVAEAGSPSVDLAMQDDITLYQGVDDAMEKIDASLLSHADELYDGAIDKSGYGVYLLWGRYGLCYRTDLVDTPPTSWKDLWDDKYIGKVTMSKVDASNGIQMLEMAAKLNGGSSTNVEPGWEAIGELASHCQTVAASTANMTDLLTTGQVVIAPWWDGRTYALAAEGVPVDFVVPDEGAYATITEFIIPKGTQKYYLAHAFIDMCIEAEAQAKLASIIKYGPVNKNTVLDDETAKVVLNGADAVSKLIFADWTVLAPQRPDFTAYYDRNIAPMIGTKVE